MSRLALAPLGVLWALGGPPSVEGEAPDIDRKALETGLAARVPDNEAWTVTLSPGPNGAIHVVAVGPEGRRAEADLTLEAVDTEGRSRELAAAAALLIESAQVPPEPDPDPEPEPDPDPEPDPEPDPQQTPRRAVRGFVGIGPRLDIGSRLTPGVSLEGGMWLLREHLEPRVELGWSTSSGDGLRLQHFRLGAGLGGGAPVGSGIVWLGGGLMAQGLITSARDVSTSTASSFAVQADALVRIRYRHFLVALEGGPGLVLPPLEVVASRTSASYGPLVGAVRLALGAEF